MSLDLFATLATDRHLHPDYIRLRDDPLLGPAKATMSEVAARMGDPDGNFVQQFQTHGFDARVFELYLQALFNAGGHQIDRSQSRPDFLLTRDGLTVAVEAVTANPAPSPDIRPYRQTPADLPEDVDGIFRFLMHEVAIKIGSPLYSKLQKRYWELPHVNGKPLVIAIENFHAGGLGLSATSVSQYVYGVRHRHWFNTDGDMIVEGEAIEEHRGSKTIPSRFFGLPGAENVSAILFSNSGTVPKFGRMGQQGRNRSEAVQMIRLGHCWDPDPNAHTHDNFAYMVGDREVPPEPWRDGAVLMHNPDALVPLPIGWMGVCAEEELQQNGTVIPTMHDLFHVYMSTTLNLPGTVPDDQVELIVAEQMRLLELGQAVGESWRETNN